MLASLKTFLVPANPSPVLVGLIPKAGGFAIG